MTAPFSPGDRIFPRARPLDPAVTVTGCELHEDNLWVVYWEYEYHPKASKVTGSGPAWKWVLDTSEVENEQS